MKFSKSAPPGGWFLAFQVGLAVLVTIGLSIWQFNRGLSKLEDKRNFEILMSQSSIEEQEWLQTPQDFAPVKLKGSLDPTRYYLIANKQHQGRQGYWIVSVLNTQHDRYLVNRGWVSVQSNIHKPPIIEPIVDTVEVIGSRWPNDIKRQTTLDTPGEWPIQLREVDIGRMARLTGSRAEEIRLKCCSPVVFQAAPPRIEYATAIHWSYAAQWIVIGLLVLGGYWFFTLRKKKVE